MGLSIGLWICVEGQDWAMIRLGKGVGLVLQKREEAEVPRGCGPSSQLDADPWACGGRERGHLACTAREGKARRGSGGAAGDRLGKGSQTSVLLYELTVLG